MTVILYFHIISLFSLTISSRGSFIYFQFKYYREWMLPNVIANMIRRFIYCPYKVRAGGGYILAAVTALRHLLATGTVYMRNWIVNFSGPERKFLYLSFSLYFKIYVVELIFVMNLIILFWSSVKLNKKTDLFDFYKGKLCALINYNRCLYEASSQCSVTLMLDFKFKI